MSAGRTWLRPRLDFSGRIKSFWANKRRALSTRGADAWGSLVGRTGGVDSVHTLGLRLGRTGAGLTRIGVVFGGETEI